MRRGRRDGGSARFDSLGPWLALGWVTNDHSSVEVDAVLKNTVKSQEWRNDASNKTPEAKKKVRFTPPPPPLSGSVYPYAAMFRVTSCPGVLTLMQLCLG